MKKPAKVKATPPKTTPPTASLAPHLKELVDYAIKSARGSSCLSDESRHRQIGEALARGVVPPPVPLSGPPSPPAGRGRIYSNRGR